jgi:Fe-S-cluster containining protein
MNILDGVNSHKKVVDNFYAEHGPDIKEAVDDVHAKLGNLSGNTLVKAVHDITEMVQKQNNFKDIIQCGKQECSFCCHSEIFLGQDEVNYIKSNAKYEIDQERLAKQRSTTKYSDLSFADRACIMLKDGKCQVYAHRPTLCRNHGATLGVDPEECHQQNLNLGTVFVEQPRAVLMEALQVYITMQNMKSIDDVKNIADYNW